MQFGSGSVKTDDFDYELPEELIAQTPLIKRDDSKLMVVDKETGKIIHETFSNIINYLVLFPTCGRKKVFLLVGNESRLVFLRGFTWGG